jgi:XTP/dITP diphosphohydrolase
MIYFASRNLHKCQEIQAMLAGGSGEAGRIMIRPCTELNPAITWDETGQTYLENARIKARAVRALTQEGVLADDSGLEVDALGGKPGVLSSSFGGIEGDHRRNTQKLLEALGDLPPSQRAAKFVCLLLYVDRKGVEWVFQGECAGTIDRGTTGDKGFGYDPVFIPLGYSKTLAQLSEDQKNQLSHRGQAFQKLVSHLAVHL